jgi:hypothetical protein
MIYTIPAAISQESMMTIILMTVSTSLGIRNFFLRRRYSKAMPGGIFIAVFPVEKQCCIVLQDNLIRYEGEKGFGKNLFKAKGLFSKWKG